MSKTKIEWTEHSWNPIRARRWDGVREWGRPGWHCEKVSAACAHCYAEAMNLRLGTSLVYHSDIRNEGEIKIFLDEKMLLAPLKWRKPKKIFVCSTTDLFGDWVDDAWLDRIFAVMALCPHHVFQLLSKRATRMREYCSNPTTPQRIAAIILQMGLDGIVSGHASLGPLGNRQREEDREFVLWPLANVWKGVTAENQAIADERIPELLATPAVVRFVSCEPLLGPVDLTKLSRPDLKLSDDDDRKWFSNALHGRFWSTRGDGGPDNKIDWVIVGGESGSHARPMHPDWARSLRDQCKAAAVAFFMKQMHVGGKLVKNIDDFPEDLRVREFPEATS